jgi:hypothetical protein
MLSKQQRNRPTSQKQQEMSEEVKVGQKAQVFGSARGEGERWSKAVFVMQGHRPRG